MQTAPEKYEGSITKAYQCIIEKEGMPFLLKGLGPTVLGYGVEGALKFGTYEVLKPVLAMLGWSQIWSFIAAGTISGILASIILCPAEDARIRMVADPKYAGLTMPQACWKLYKKEGVGSVFSGFSAMIAKQVPYTITKQCVFDLITFTMMTSTRINGLGLPAMTCSIIAAVLTSVPSCIASQPGDVLLTQTYKGSNHATYGSLVRDVYASGGIPAFFTGLKARLLMTSTIITIQLVVYDFLRQQLRYTTSGF